MDDQRLIADIASDVQDLDNQVRGIAAASQRRYRMGIQPGRTVQEFGEYTVADDEGRAEIRDACRSAYEQIMADVDRHIDAANRTMTTPASADDVSTVSFTLARENVTRDELQALLDRYRGNHQLAAGIIERAHKGGIYLDGEPDSVRVFREDAARAAGRVLNRYNSQSVILPADDFAANVVMKLRHLDILGNAY